MALKGYAVIFFLHMFQITFLNPCHQSKKLDILMSPFIYMLKFEKHNPRHFFLSPHGIDFIV